MIFDVKEDYYHATIYREILANKEQAMKKEFFPETNFVTCDPDDNEDWESMNWIKDITTSFAEKTLEDLHLRIQKHYKSSPYTATGILASDGYLYWFSTHYLIKEKMLFREKIHLSKCAHIDYADGFLESLKSTP